ncbi:MAG: tryptophan--tRNA ligase [Myxococcota bacterium]
MTTLPRVLSGDRPTGPLHLGHLVGSLTQRVRLQRDHEVFILIADLHVLTTRQQPNELDQIEKNVRGLLLDYLSVGIDPQRCTIGLQSAIPEICELAVLLSNLTPAARLQRLPSLKEMARHAAIEGMSMGLLGYPVLQAADILSARAGLIPVGRDNLPHIELARELARRFNRLYGETFPEPKPIVMGETLVGIDNLGKMSKSAGNAIFLRDDPAVVRKKVRRMYTDPNRIHADIPGTVEGNPIFLFHDRFNPDGTMVESLKARYRAGTVGDGEVKARLLEALEATLAPIRARRLQIEARPGLIERTLIEGTERMRQQAQQTLRSVRRAMRLDQTLIRARRRLNRIG